MRDEEGLPPAAQRGVYAHALVVRRHAPREGPGMGHHVVLGHHPFPWRDRRDTHPGLICHHHLAPES